MNRIIYLSIVILFLASCTSSQHGIEVPKDEVEVASEDFIIDTSDVKMFWGELQSCLKSGNVDSLKELMSFPIYIGYGIEYQNVFSMEYKDTILEKEDEALNEVNFEKLHTLFFTQELVTSILSVDTNSLVDYMVDHCPSHIDVALEPRDFGGNPTAEFALTVHVYYSEKKKRFRAGFTACC